MPTPTATAAPRIWITPAPGRRVRDPWAGYLLVPAEGKLVRANSYWARRIRSGDVTKSEPPTRKAVRRTRPPAAE